jgi:hypothetical protein
VAGSQTSLKQVDGPQVIPPLLLVLPLLVEEARLVPLDEEPCVDTELPLLEPPPVEPLLPEEFPPVAPLTLALPQAARTTASASAIPFGPSEVEDRTALS